MPAAVAHWQKGLDTGSKADRVRLMGIGAAQRGSVVDSLPARRLAQLITRTRTLGEHLPESDRHYISQTYVPREDMLPIITDPVSFHVDAAPRTSRCSSASPCT